jgi:NhaP-type Na+/H+ or K+/H+ antiporter
MGFALLSIDIDVHLPKAAAGGILLAVVTRLISVAIPSTLVHLRHLPKLRGIAVLTWGGLRGGISVALALTLEPSPYRGTMLAICYAVVVFTILVQGLSMPLLVRRCFLLQQSRYDHREQPEDQVDPDQLANVVHTGGHPAAVGGAAELAVGTKEDRQEHRRHQQA